MNAGQHTPDSDVVERLDDAQRIDSLRGLLAELQRELDAIGQ